MAREGHRSRAARLAALERVWLFEQCTRKQLAAVVRLATIERAPIGTVLTTEGESGDDFFVLLRGACVIEQRGIGCRTMRPGAAFGELALVDGGPRSATITAIDDCELLVVTRRDFAALVDAVPAIAVQLLAATAARLRTADRERVRLRVRLRASLPAAQVGAPAAVRA